ncbi:5-hydroxytryptamine receptor 4-like [Strongylocentrotus purpuratus]|uniref:G-protein coupled receptors family 1 profile domain-containing protein n=1 Tax=Strongylocentrotus purpuratus TaxID=7668 RepID=A0A7M7NH10_STRPU|nr:5-hydroxytryptamine receptor 4-like [Strongylocentrotus purpuratus]|eukprot:XP_003727696.1 PREDICTED: 5-hydroxytryptamine receptor 4-like [Strongylocentrotus purpuratus]
MSGEVNTTDETGSGGGKDFRFTDYNQRLVLAITFIVISVVGSIGNSIVIAAVAMSRKLRTATNVFVVSLAIADLLTNLFLPWNVIALLNEDREQWPMEESLCVMAAIILYTCVGSSVYSLAAIGLNRFVLITQPIHVYHHYYSKVRMGIMVMFTWVIPLFLSLLPLIFGLGQLGYDAKYGTCTHKTSHPLSDYYSLTQAVIIYPIPLTVILVSYVAIYVHVRAHTKTITEIQDTSESSSSTHKPKRRESTARRSISKRQVEITKNLFYVVCAFVLCITPYCASLVIPGSESFIPWAGAIILMNACINPVIYATKHPHFKKVMFAIIRCRLSAIPEPSSDCLRAQGQPIPSR